MEFCSANTDANTAILHTYGRAALKAQKASNCVTTSVLQIPSQTSSPRALEGVPISIKDCIDVSGYDSTVGFASNAFKPATSDSAIVRLLRDAGASFVCKTTNPTGLFGAETMSDLFGYTSNPWNPLFSSGASGGGGGALLAHGGSVIEIGTDIGGSVRIPAHFCGVVGLRTGVGRLPTQGCRGVAPGFEGIHCTTGVMARRVEDMEAFMERVIKLEPWKYDTEVIWRRGSNCRYLC